MELENIKELIAKYNRGTATEAERIEMITWYESIAGNDPEFATGEFDALKNEVYQSLEEYRLENPIRTKRIKLWPRIAVIAAAVAAIVFGIWFYNTRYMNARHPELVSGPQYKNDVAPGKNTATLTLPNGKTINLSDAKTGVVIGAMNDATQLTYNDGSLVRSSLRGDTTKQSHEEIASIPRNDGMMLTAATPRGGTYQFTLPDGTQVWLNAASKISFPSQFSGTNRKILLSGEAYFEVAKNKAKPFIVESNGQEVTVLGTHFNINAYPDENNTKTTLLEGSVRVSTLLSPASSLRGGTTRQPHDEILKPGEQATNTGATIKITPANIEETLAWKNGEFIFNNEPLSEILKKVSRWYNVTIIYNLKVNQAETFGGKVSRSKPVSAVLNSIEATGKVKFDIQGYTVTVK